MAGAPRKPSFPIPPGAPRPSGPPLTPCLPPLIFHIQGLQRHMDPRGAGAGWRPSACGSWAAAAGDALGKDTERPSPGGGPRTRCPPGGPRGGASVVGVGVARDGRSGQVCKVTQGPAAYPGGFGRELGKGQVFSVRRQGGLGSARGAPATPTRMSTRKIPEDSEGQPS